MDFAYTPEQEALRDLVRTILTDHATHERLRTLERDGWFDRDLWRALAQANILGLALPESHGGSGLGLLELCMVLEEVGRTVAPVPLLASLVLGALPIAHAGSAAQQRALLPGIAGGEVIATAALVELGANAPTAPATSARADGARWRLDGVKVCVPAATLATHVVVPARTPGGVGLFLVDPRGAGVRVEPQVLTHGEPHGRLTLSGATGEPLGDPAAGAVVLAWLEPRAIVAVCATQLGVCDRALRMAATYTSEREQFGRAVGSFQAVHTRAADAYIDVECIRLSTWEAIDRLANDEPADDAVAIAKFWAAEGGQRVAVAAQHLHGGIGVDVDYPLHRYFLWAKHLELVLGCGTEHLARLGTRIAADADDSRR